MLRINDLIIIIKQIVFEKMFCYNDVILLKI